MARVGWKSTTWVHLAVSLSSTRKPLRHSLYWQAPNSCPFQGTGGVQTPALHLCHFISSKSLNGFPNMHLRLTVLLILSICLSSFAWSSWFPAWMSCLEDCCNTFCNWLLFWDPEALDFIPSLPPIFNKMLTINSHTDCSWRSWNLKPPWTRNRNTWPSPTHPSVHLLAQRFYVGHIHFHLQELQSTQSQYDCSLAYNCFPAMTCLSESIKLAKTQSSSEGFQ